MHLREPGCAVAAAKDAGKILARRMASYRQLVGQARNCRVGIRNSGDELASGERMGKRAAVDVFEFSADRNAMGNS